MKKNIDKLQKQYDKMNSYKLRILLSLKSILGRYWLIEKYGTDNLNKLLELEFFDIFHPINIDNMLFFRIEHDYRFRSFKLVLDAAGFELQEVSYDMRKKDETRKIYLIRENKERIEIMKKLAFCS